MEKIYFSISFFRQVRAKFVGRKRKESLLEILPERVPLLRIGFASSENLISYVRLPVSKSV